MPQIHPDPQEAEPAAERMEDRRDTGMVAEHRGDIVVGFAGVDHGRLMSLAREVELGVERDPLGLTGRVVVVIVESHLSSRHHPGIGEHAPEPSGLLRVPTRRLVGVETGRGREPGVGIYEANGAVCGLPRLADDDHVIDARRPGTLQYGGAVRIVRRIAQVAVAVDQATGRGLRPAGAGTAGALVVRVPRADGPGHRFSIAMSTGDAI